MTQDEIIRSPLGREQLVALAREAGVVPTLVGGHKAEYFKLLERFAALVAEATKEECIEIVRTIGGKFAQEAEAAIRGMK